MIISYSKKYVFISTPKTGSHSFFHLLKEEFDGRRLMPFHRTEVPEYTEGYTIFTTCRNPYERFTALWHSIFFSCGTKNDPHGYRKSWMSEVGSDDPVKFAKYLVQAFREETTPARYPQLVIPQYLWYRRMPGETKIIHIENASEEFHKLPFVGNKRVKIPHKLKRDHQTWDDIQTPELLHWVNQWAKGDFELLGYEKK